MNLKIIFTQFVLILLIYNKGHGQSVSPYLISSGGDIYFEDYTVHWAIGEIAVTELKNGINVTQGFYQAYNYKTETFEYDDGHTVSFYPNPVSNYLMIEHDYPNAISLSIYDIIGRNLLVHHEILSQTNLDLSGLQTGTYIIKFINDDGKYQSKKFIKI
ncbi:MAG: T9SS type A sorting domain-containing protein [Saprospiraceae bacterium]